MNIVKNEYVTFWDVDGTLVTHDLTAPGNLIYVDDPVSGKTIKVIENVPMTRLMNEEYYRGAHIVVWSRGGNAWAANVVKALGLEAIVNTVMSKPVSYMDDIEIGDWLKQRVFLPPDAKYKNVHTD